MIQENSIVTVPKDNRLFAKVHALSGDEVTLEYFHSVVDREFDQMRICDCIHSCLPKQTRAFISDFTGEWRVGRIIDHLVEDDGSYIYSIQFPNKKVAEYPEQSIYVRCLDVFADPANILAEGCSEAQYYADRRRKALKQIRGLRSATQGLTGLTSSGIELVPHQVAAARRVLNDSIQRYLLADEVGLGKTCEAGIVIRQILIDYPSSRIVLLVPHALVSQWSSELDLRFGVFEFVEAKVSICAYEDVLQFNEELSPDLLVIDEAHNIVSTAGNTTSVAERIALLANNTERLLLLSATPPLGEEEHLLGLLNLLDPANYPLDDIIGFRRKVEKRQEIGHLLLPLRHGMQSIVLRTQVLKAAKMFPNDDVIQSEVERIDRICNSGKDQFDLDKAVESIREYIVRTYRLHDRVIRTRRIDASDWFFPRGGEWPAMPHVRIEFASEASVDGIGATLESWRLDAVSESSNIQHSLLASRYKGIISAIWGGPQELLHHLQTQEPMFSSEQDHFESMMMWARDSENTEQRDTAVVAALWDLVKAIGGPKNNPKIICFTDNSNPSLTFPQRPEP